MKFSFLYCSGIDWFIFAMQPNHFIFLLPMLIKHSSNLEILHFSAILLLLLVIQNFKQKFLLDLLKLLKLSIYSIIILDCFYFGILAKDESDEALKQICFNTSCNVGISEEKLSFNGSVYCQSISYFCTVFGVSECYL